LDKPTTNNSISTVNLLIARSLTNKEQQSVERDGKSSLFRRGDFFFKFILEVIVQHIDEFHRRWKQTTPEK
jgi:hypothetical protein